MPFCARLSTSKGLVANVSSPLRDHPQTIRRKIHRSLVERIIGTVLLYRDCSLLYSTSDTRNEVVKFISVMIIAANVPSLDKVVCGTCQVEVLGITLPLSPNLLHIFVNSNNNMLLHMFIYNIRSDEIGKGKKSLYSI